jgi:hypothetical protein
MFPKYIRILILVISLCTMVAGLLQTVNPGMVLHLVEADASQFPSHLFATIGMFMLLFGGLAVHSLYSAYPDHVALFWCALQKAGAAIAVIIGMMKGVFGHMAGFVAAFDCLSAVLFFLYLAQSRSNRQA